MMIKASKALAPLCATIVGVLTFVGWLSPWIAVAMLVLGVAGLLAARLSLGRNPTFAAVAISLWIFTGISIMAGVTASLLWLTLHIPQLFPYLPPDTLKEVAATLTGAITTLAGVAVTKDMEEGGGFFWPGTQFKSSVAGVFSGPGRTPTADSVEWEAVYDDRVRDGTRGWGFRARIRRARILAVD